MMSNEDNRVLYVGMTNNIRRRVYEHQNSLVEGFTKRYKTKKLVYMEEYPTAYEAITREKVLKGWLRVKKNELVSTINPNWQDLAKFL
jgi:putative endonuclease